MTTPTHNNMTNPSYHRTTLLFQSVLSSLIHHSFHLFFFLFCFWLAGWGYKVYTVDYQLYQTPLFSPNMKSSLYFSGLCCSDDITDIHSLKDFTEKGITILESSSFYYACGHACPACPPPDSPSPPLTCGLSFRSISSGKNIAVVKKNEVCMSSRSPFIH